MIQDSGRADVAALLLRHLLDTYAGVQAAQEAGAEQLAAKVSPLLLLQCITQLLQAFQEQLLKAEPDVVLSFIDFALRGTNIAEVSPKKSNLQAPLIVPLPADGSHSQLPDGALDDETEAAADGSGSMEMSTELVCVALELLLALLEGHPDMTPSSHTLLHGIARFADHHAAGDVKVAKLAREVQLVLLARRHSARGPTAGKRASETSSPVQRGNALYNKALRLLQDPIVPVRAHGLTVLGDLVREADGVRMEAALVPALLDILIQIVQDEESFLYLNAIKVLAALARRRDSDSRTLGRLVDVYVGAISPRSLSMHASELDKRLRVGEALLLVIKQSEIQATELIAPLLSALASAYVPATLRSSVISVLGTTVEANPLRIAATGHAEQMALAMFDLLALELQGAKTSAEVDEKEKRGGAGMEDASKPAQLRRSAFHLLALLIRGSKHQIEALQQDRGPAESLSSLRLPNGSNLPSISANVDAHRAIQEAGPLLFDPAKAQMVERARTLSSYARAVDVDAVVQIQAGELLADLEALQVVYLQSNR
ncbi:Uncharacterized conserved protein [Ceraceosorus bombacis]|uniref:Uncharacterized conserved protein n=1 Tax=Ceraceosorus bombacis TaxID=401625 RepID=A0A0P1B8N7_9BASI|nr:Uncharacterized conserved protein [Ceraceosorus bombacis]